MTTPIRWGIVATGTISSRFVQDLVHAPGAVAAAVASRSADTAAAFAASHGLPKAYGSWDELAAAPDIDIVYIGTPHYFHHEVAAMMLGAGKAVLCEKAFTMSAGEAEDLIELARANRVFLMEAMWMRANPAIRAAAALVADGAIGEVVSVRADISLPQEPAPDHRLRDPHLGGGALLDLGVYAVSLAHLVLGDLELVGAHGEMFPEGSDRRTAMLLRANSGAVAQLACGMHADYPTDATISGTAGRIDIPSRFYRPHGFTLHRDGAVEHFDLPYRGNGLHYQAIEAMESLRTGAIESDLIPLSATLSVMRTLDDVATYIGLRYP